SRPRSKAAALPQASPKAVSRLAAEPPPSRLTASIRARSVVKRFTSWNGGLWLNTSCVANGVMLHVLGWPAHGLCAPVPGMGNTAPGWRHGVDAETSRVARLAPLDRYRLSTSRPLITAGSLGQGEARRRSA